MGIRAGCTVIAVAAAISAWLQAGEARAANGAYAVDAADISEAGACKVESWLWDRSVDRHYLAYGIGFDWKFTETLQWTIEAFGQAGQSDTPSVVQPRFQTGVRYRPNEIFSVDLIYGRNITGENANWITLGTTIRFPLPAGKPEHH